MLGSTCAAVGMETYPWRLNAGNTMPWHGVWFDKTLIMVSIEAIRSKWTGFVRVENFGFSKIGNAIWYSWTYNMIWYISSKVSVISPCYAYESRMYRLWSAWSQIWDWYQRTEHSWTWHGRITEISYKLKNQVKKPLFIEKYHPKLHSM